MKIQSMIKTALEARAAHEARFAHSRDGLKANTQGKVKGALLGRAVGATRAAGLDDNTWMIEGKKIRFHTINDKTGFTLNPETEPDHIVLATYSHGFTLLDGVTLADCLAHGTATNTKRFRIGMGKLKSRVALGFATFPEELVNIETVEERAKALAAIDQMTDDELMAIVDPETKHQIWDFVGANGTIEEEEQIEIATMSI